jgi:hypothetical protein
MVFNTLDEALDNQVLCGICGRPKKSLQAFHTAGSSYYKLVRCKEFRCFIHCSKKDGCSHKRP